MDVVRFKKGATIVIAGEYAENGEAADLSDYTIRSQVRDSLGGLLDTLVVTKADDQGGAGKGRFVLEPVMNPPDWPIDALVCDVKITDAVGVVRPFPTVQLVIEQNVTV